MKPGLVIAMVLLALVGSAFAVYYYNSQRVGLEKAPSACSDPDSIASHVYNPDRLVVYKNCLTVSGAVDKKIVEADGDYHIRLGLDPQYRNLTNTANENLQRGDLVLEIVCANEVSQPDAVDACQNYVNHITVPQEGQHIVATGPYVLDSAHGWMEIHPVYSLTIS